MECRQRWISSTLRLHYACTIICKLTTQQQEAREEKREEGKTITGGSTNSRTNCPVLPPVIVCYASLCHSACKPTACSGCCTWRAYIHCNTIFACRQMQLRADKSVDKNRSCLHAVAHWFSARLPHLVQSADKKAIKCRTRARGYLMKAKSTPSGRMEAPYFWRSFSNKAMVSLANPWPFHVLVLVISTQHWLVSG